eukprot:CAMPEP_0117523564 /NCGR_PEP_ID=MMETSP0784-20121206/34792_1 /TAXON_ID=39447 /ORGANISM="" /LENGTH=334 /DNA_ID=CAMNT_0005319679 /DNA_START=462 /DNA_END=1463 /DNA_ORIENTATION=-
MVALFVCECRCNESMDFPIRQCAALCTFQIATGASAGHTVACPSETLRSFAIPLQDEEHWSQAMDMDWNSTGRTSGVSSFSLNTSADVRYVAAAMYSDVSVVEGTLLDRALRAFDLHRRKCESNLFCGVVSTVLVKTDVGSTATPGTFALKISTFDWPVTPTAFRTQLIDGTGLHNVTSVSYLKNVPAASLHTLVEKRALDVCNYSITILFLSFCLLQSASMLMLVIVYKYVMNRCSDLVEAARQFSITEYSNSDDDFDVLSSRGSFGALDVPSQPSDFNRHMLSSPQPSLPQSFHSSPSEVPSFGWGRNMECQGSAMTDSAMTDEASTRMGVV